MQPQQLSELQKKVEEIVLGVGGYVFSQWGEVATEQKGNEGDVVTEVDRTAEKDIRDKLEGLVDSAQIMGEEYGGELGDGYVWLIDPIDGTKHFAHKMCSFFIQVSLLYKKEPIIGVVYDPVAKQLFSASLGNGTFLNSVRQKCGGSVPIEKSVIDIDFGGKEDVDWKADVFRHLASKAYRVRVSGGRFAHYLLTGGINALLVVNPTTKIWDQAPRIIFSREAGFDVRKVEKNGHAVWVMAEPDLADKIWEIINNTK